VGDNAGSSCRFFTQPTVPWTRFMSLSFIPYYQAQQF
jgi:hypothetical protein